MPNPSSNHLRLHVGDARPTGISSLDLPAWEPLQSAYHGLTGWQLKCQVGEIPASAEPVGHIPRLFGDQEGQLFRLPGSSRPAPESNDRYAREMAEAIAGILLELQETRHALQQREAELATAVPVIARRDEGADFNHRLQAILRGAVEGLKGAAAALYLLDDTTTELKLRSHWGLPSLRFLEPARPLRGAVADLEALTGHAVVLEDTSLFAHWNVPEAFAAAVCVPVESPDALLGCFWFFDDRVRDFGPDETQLLEIIAGRLAAELERRVLIQDAARSSRSRDQLEELRVWHEAKAIQASPVVDGWQAGYSIVQGGSECGDFGTWHVDSSDRLLLAASSISGTPVQSTMSATLFQGAVQATLRQFISPRSTLQTLNGVLYSTAPGGASASSFVGALDASTGELDFASAGSSDAFILRPHGWEPIVEDGAALGHGPDWTGRRLTQQVQPGDVLFVISDRHLNRQEQDAEFDTTSLAETLLRHVHLSARDLAGFAAQRIAQQCSDPWARLILVLKRAESQALA